MRLSTVTFANPVIPAQAGIQRDGRTGCAISLIHLVQTQKERDLVADAIGDNPETAIPAHLVKRGLADAYAEGSMSQFDAIVVQSRSLPLEPWCFGTDHYSVLALLRQLDGWGRRRMSPNVPADLAGPLSALIKQATILDVQHYGDIYHTLTGRVNEFATPEVRILDQRDSGLLSAFESDPHRLGFNTFEDLLTIGSAAGAVVDGRLVALAHTNAVTAEYGDIGVYTDDAWRGMGFATASASIVARRIQDLGRTPVWSAGEDNAASLRIAAKLGFVEVSRRVYLNTLRA